MSAFIGKNVIENLTIAMYEDLRVIFREYVQNSADAIDKAVAKGVIDAKFAHIDIHIDEGQRKIVIEDNGYGIPRHEFKEIMSSIASSNKSRDDDKGFRGIGRLGGVSSCRLLRFTCSAKGENVASQCVWDAQRTREIISDQNQNPSAADLVNSVTSYSVFECAPEKHFFKVELIDVEPSHDVLLDIDSVKEYLVSVAPLPYSVGFPLAEKIEGFARENGFTIDEYNINLNGHPLCKPYKQTLYEKNQQTVYDIVKDVDFAIFNDDLDNVLAWCWYGLSSLEKQIPETNIERSIRLRKYNIQIGDENTFTVHDFYKESRSAAYFVGEVFAIHSGLVPNARRDYFNPNDTCMAFEKVVRPFFLDKLCKLYRDANTYKNAQNSKLKAEEARQQYDEKSETGTFIDEQEEEEQRNKVAKLEEKANNEDKKLRSLREKENSGRLAPAWSVIREAIDSRFENKTDKADAQDRPVQQKKSTNKEQAMFLTDHLTNLLPNERKLVEKIYQIIRNVLVPNEASELIKVIQRKLSK